MRTAYVQIMGMCVVVTLSNSLRVAGYKPGSPRDSLIWDRLGRMAKHRTPIYMGPYFRLQR